MPRVTRTKNAEQFYKDDPEYIAIDTETTGVEFHDEAFCATIAWRGGDGRIHSSYYSLPRCRPELRILVRNRKWVFHNCKFDLQKLIYAGVIDRATVTSGRIEDTEALAHLINENQKKNLKELARVYLGKTTNEETELRRIRRRLRLRKSDGFERLPSLTVVPYALKDAEFTYELWEKLMDTIDPKLRILYREELELSLVLLDMEAAGLGVDKPLLNKTIREHNDRLWKLDNAISFLVGKPIKEGLTKPKDKGKFFNPNSYPQLLEAFKERGTTLPGTDKDSLASVLDPLAQVILERRKIKKLNESWLIPIQENEKDGVYHGNIRQHKTRTGRLAGGSSED